MKVRESYIRQGWLLWGDVGCLFFFFFGGGFYKVKFEMNFYEAIENWNPRWWFQRFFYFQPYQPY